MNGPDNALHVVIQQAIQNTSEGITIADARLPDMPLVYVNPAFYAMTGYGPEETLGYNCRFLQGPDTAPEAVAALRSAIAAREQCVVELMNYRKDGTPFWNRLSLVPVFDGDTLTHYVGIQSDLTAVKEADKARAQLAAMRTTMSTVNDVVRNFMNNVEYFRMQLEEQAAGDPALIAEYETSFNDTLDKLTILSTAQTYHEREVATGIMGIDMARLRPPTTDHRPPETNE
jgi:PAS domain S-box-containing protein